LENKWKAIQSASAFAQHIFWSQCKDADGTMAGGKKSTKYINPFLKLYSHIPLIYTNNTPNGEANRMLYIALTSILTNK
jgi:hypothetical protein